MGKILTISIASYNVEKFLDQTLASFIIEKDKMADLEIIIVNDGSKDGTVKVANKYVDNYPETFVLIDKENGGYGSTINASLKIARGKYFKLVDGDDWVETDGLVKLIDFLKNIDSDMVLTKYCSCEEGTGRRTIVDEGLTFDNKQHELNYLYGHSLPMHFISFKTELLKKYKIKITEKCFYTDLEFVVKPLPFVNTVSLLNELVYVYRTGRDEQSVSMKSWQKNLGQAIDVTLELARYYENIKREIKVDDRIEFIRSKVVDSAINNYRIFLSFKSCNEVRNKIKDYTKKIELASAEIAKLSKENMLVKLLLLPGYPLYRILSFVYRRHLKKKGML